MPRLRMGRRGYRVSDKSVLGEGATAVVYKGMDIDSGQAVAVKVYLKADDQAHEQFMRTINVWNKLAASADGFRRSSDVEDALSRQHSYNNDSIMREVARSLGDVCDDHTFYELVACMDIRRCFAQLLDYSKDEDLEPGVEPGTGELWIVQELGSESLEQEIERRSETGDQMTAPALLDLAWSLLCITWGLHMCGFVHMDIKPMNIVRVAGQGEGDEADETQVAWKLIDLDGAMPAHSPVGMDSDKVCFTPVFMPPELARMMSGNTETIQASRLMDVWSVGMCIMQAIFGVPVLEPWFQEWADETGGNAKFFEWLGDYDTEPIVHGDMEKHLRSISPGLNTILKNMLRKDPEQRFCSARCLMHPTFRQHRRKLLRADSAIQEWMEVRKSLPEVRDYFGEADGKQAHRSKACSVM